MADNQPELIYLEDYTPPAFEVKDVFLHFDLRDNGAHVKTVLKLSRHPAAENEAALVLYGEQMNLLSIKLDGHLLPETRYQVNDYQLVLPDVPDDFILETEVMIKPEENFSGSGLYLAKGNYCTQCEPHGFRRITYFPDRPDVLSRFTTTITADKKRYPVLLSNGNLIEQKELSEGRHWIKWEDPSLKPAYLFALVAGDYECLEDEFTTCSGRQVQLKLYVEKGNLDQSQHGMECLKRAMKWDEDTFGREYDLDIYMIVAVSTFNMGAMENKGLNIFNDKYILAKPQTATDTDYMNIESVIGHEYFHNWSGNRVTVRDWFQITLKEGLTIFRDQSFTADMTSSAVKRIHDANIIRTMQFAQDAGPMAHPIRPDHYVEINNFYTVTVYHKGAEVIRMLQTILGKEKFRQAMDLYFSRNDGKAVTTENFVKAMEDASGLDLTQFRLWYSQAGTPVLQVTDNYNAQSKTYQLTVTQTCPPTPDQKQKKSFYIPLAIGLLNDKGEDLLPEKTQVLIVNQTKQSFVFENISAKPVVSLLRNFSAPVKIEYDYSQSDLLFLMQHDSDSFNQWNAAQRIMTDIIKTAMIKKEEAARVCSKEFIAALSYVLQNEQLDESFRAELLTLPSENYLIESVDVANVEAIHRVRNQLLHYIAQSLKTEFIQAYKQLVDKQYEFNGKACGRRKLKNTCLAYLVLLEDKQGQQLCEKQYHQADNMTDTMGALTAINHVDGELRRQLLLHFYQRWQKESLVVDKWLVLHAMAPIDNALAQVKWLMQQPLFDIKNPNKVRALIDMFCRNNPINFHAKDGSGYRFLADQVIAIDQFNPQVAARSVEALIHWRKFDGNRQQLMKAELERIANSKKLSKDVYELVSKSLQHSVEQGV